MKKQIEWLCRCGKWYNNTNAKQNHLFRQKVVGNLIGFNVVNSYCPYCNQNQKGNVSKGIIYNDDNSVKNRWDIKLKKKV